MKKSEKSITEIVNGYRVLIDFEVNVVLKNRESSEDIGRHGYDLPRFLKLIFSRLCLE